MASRFWVGGTGTWDNSTTTHWAASTGGGGGSSVPAAGDTVTFDGASGGGTVTVAATINGSNTVTSITMGAFTGTLDLSANNPSLTMGNFSASGSGTSTLNLGSGTFTVTATQTTPWDATNTNLTFVCGTSTLLFQSSSTAVNGRAFNSGGKTYAIVRISATNCGGMPVTINAAPTIGTLTIDAGALATFATSVTTTITNAFAFTGTSGSPIILTGVGGGTATVSAASGSTIAWASISHITFSNTAVTATNSLDGGGNNMNSGSITAPTSGVVGVIGS